MGAASSFPGLPKACRSLPAVLLALAATLSSLAEDTVDLRVEAVGAFNAFRPGDVTGLRVQARSRLEQPVECLLQWELSNADGDLVTHTRQVTLAPGQPASRWLYARLPPVAPSELSDEVFTVRAFELQDGRRQRELGVVRFRTADAGQRSMPVGLREGLVGVIGDGRGGTRAARGHFRGREHSLDGGSDADRAAAPAR